MKELFLLVLSVYSLTFVVASSSILKPFRKWFISKTPWLKIEERPHFIECRMCVGFWVTLAVCNTNYGVILAVYGLSYFLATQER